MKESFISGKIPPSLEKIEPCLEELVKVIENQPITEEFIEKEIRLYERLAQENEKLERESRMTNYKLLTTFFCV